MILRSTSVCFLLAVIAGCAQTPSGGLGSSHRHTFGQPPAEAARCFARNAEEHSSALVAEISTSSDAAQVVVRVKNGVHYATADFRRSGSGAVGTIALNVRTSGRTSDLLDNLVEGC
jgi:hypothetical protein